MPLLLSLLLLGAVVPVAQAAPNLSGTRPNIIFILTDDQGYGDLSCHGNPVLKTPNLDRIHAEGVRFTDFIVSPTCAPTRSALMTGRHEFRNGVTHTINERERLTLSATTIAQVLKQAGYTTGIFGKWHLGDEPEYQPNRRGFDETFIHGAGGIGQTYVGSCGDAPGNTYFNPAILHNGKFEKTTGYCTDVFFKQALTWIEQVKGKQPFYAHISPNAPHAPLQVRPEDEARYAGKVPTNTAKFYGMIVNIDDNVGTLLEALRRWDIERNTLVIFMNDNGGTAGVQVFNAGMRAQKGTPWMGGIRAASLWRWPGTLRPVDVPALTAHIDFFPTLAELAGAKLSSEVQAQVEGRSLVPLLLDPGASWPECTLVTHVGRWERGRAADAKYRNCSLRSSRWQMVSASRTGVKDWQLFDLKADPSQKTDVASTHREVVKELETTYDRWWDSVQPQLVNENAVGPDVNPFKALYWKQFGGGPEESHKPASTGVRPNILWIVSEDINPHLGCYGDTNAITPTLDRLAARGLRYTRCWSVAPVCAPARTALISGVYPNSTGGEHMRSEVRMPSFMRMYPQFLADQGYYCVNNSKEDYNLTKPGKVWAESSARAHYRNRPAGQPFFAAFNIELTHESQIRKRPHTLQHDPATMRLPAYHPDTPEVRHDWAQYYDNLTAMDSVASNRLAELEREGLADDTIIFFYGDNGSGMPRSKRWPYNSGLHVPLIVYVPEKLKSFAPRDYLPGATSDRLVSFVDFAPTLLSLAGMEPPAWMQGHAFMGTHETAPPKYIHGLRGRMDERYDLVRSVRNDRYIYIRNYMPHLIYGQYIDYMFQTPTTRVWKELYDKGRLKPPQNFFWEPKPSEELYDLESDPDEVRNLVASQQHAAVLDELRQAQREQVLRVRDVGLLPEAEMHRRAAGTTIYEMGHEDAKYPLEKVLAMAELASRLRPEAIPQLKTGLKDPDSAVRYWAALGLLMRGSTVVKQSLPELRNALEDAAPSVRIVAAQGCGQFGEAADLKRALAVLKDLVQPEKSSAYAAIHALNVVAALGPKAAPLLETIRTMSTKDPDAPERANSYVPRLVTELTGQAAPAAAPKKGKAKQPKRPEGRS